MQCSLHTFKCYPLQIVNIERLLVIVLGQLDGGTPIGIWRIDALIHLQLGGIRIRGRHVHEGLEPGPLQRQLNQFVRTACVHQYSLTQRIIEAVANQAKKM